MMRAPTLSWAALSLVAVAIVACGSESDGGGSGNQGGGGGAFVSEVPPFTAGSRLSPRFLDGGGGARVLFDFYDHQLGTSCAFYPTPDGTFRCLPETRVECAEVFFGACGAPAFATVLETNACGVTVATAAVQAPAGSPPPHPLHDVRLPNCGGGGASVGAWEGATEVPLDQFVGGQLTSVALEGDLALEQVVADDGTSVTIGFTRKGASCTAAWFGGELRCLDAHEAFMGLSDGGELFVGPGCSGDRAAQYGSECGEPKPSLATTATQDAGVCPGDTQHFELLEDVAEVSKHVAGQCFDGFESEATFARAGAEVPASALPVLQSVQVGSGRLRALLLAGGGSALGSTTMRSGSHDRRFYDSELDTACEAQITSDGQVRCIPGSIYPFAYGDPQCTQVVMPGEVGGCGPVIEDRFLPHPVPNDCGGGFVASEVWERGEPFVGTVYGVGGDGSCVPLQDEGAWFTLGAVHPLEDFAKVSLSE